MADYQYIDLTGVIVPDTGDILVEVQNEYKTALGADLVVTPDTPQGVLIVGETQSRTAVINNNAALANQINPNLAGGVFLDAICALTGLQRIPATPTVVQATISGVPSTIIPAGSRAQTEAQDVFQTTGAVVIGGGGTVTANFQSIEYGPVACAAHALNQIIDGVLGWEGVDNASDAAPGRLLQSDQSLRALRKLSLALQGVSLPEAIISALYLVPGVTSLTFLENIAATTQTIQGISMVAHSIYACVNGGLDIDVATALLEKKSGGCAYNGGTSVNVTEPSSGQVYVVKFDRPTAVPFKARATVSVSSSLIDPTVAVPAAIINYANGGLDGIAGLVVGQDVSSFELAGAVTAQYPGIYVSKMETSVDGGTTWVTTPITIAVNQIATIASSDISVIIV